MTESIANLVVLLAAVYLAVGFVLAVLVAAGLWRRIDPDAIAGSPGFRVLVIPGATLLWPWILIRVLRSGEGKVPS